eukprot:7431139-Pyramimonas_sp.AAC.1
MPRRSQNGLAAAPRMPRLPSTIRVLDGPKIGVQHARLAERKRSEERCPASLESPWGRFTACHLSTLSIM